MSALLVFVTPVGAIAASVAALLGGSMAVILIAYAVGSLIGLVACVGARLFVLRGSTSTLVREALSDAPNATTKSLKP